MTVQREITGAEYLAQVDAYSSAIKAVLAVTGDEDTPGTAAAYAADVRDLITAFAAPDEADITADFIDAVIAVVGTWAAESALAARFSQFNSAMRSHLGADLNAWLISEAAGRVPHYWRRGGDTAITPVNVFPPETVLATVAVTGSGTRTLTLGSVVPIALYGGAQAALKVTEGTIGAASIVATVTGLDFGGTSRTWTGTIPNGSTIGTVVNLTGTGVTTAISVTACTFTGGTNLDDFAIVTVEDRVIT